MQLVAAASWYPLHFLQFYLQTFAQPSLNENLHFWMCQQESVLVWEGRKGSLRPCPLCLGPLHRVPSPWELWDSKSHYDILESLLLALTSGQRPYLKLEKN